MRLNLKFIPFILMPLLFVAGCEKDPEPINEEELITTVILTFSPDDSLKIEKTMRFSDTDGPGGNAPVITSDTLDINTQYNLALSFLDESTPVSNNINLEILAEAEDHQVFYTIGNNVYLTVSYADTDANGFPIGLKATAETGAAGSGTMRLSLIHLPNKTAQGVSAGVIDNAGGETDVEVNFTVIIQ